VVTRNSHSASTMYTIHKIRALRIRRIACTCVGFSRGEGDDKKDEIKNKITNRDVAVIRASGNNNYYHYGPGRRIIIICESVVVSRHTHTHKHSRVYTEKFKNNNNSSRLVGCRY